MTDDALELQVLGCGDAMGSGGRLQTCFSLRRGDRRILVDFGATAMIALRRYAIDPDGVDSVLLTHLHGDHFGGLPFLLLDARWVSERRRPLRIVGPRGTSDRLQVLRETLYPGSTRGDLGFELRVEEVDAGSEYDLDGIRLNPLEVVHKSGSPALGLKLSWGDRSVAYSGDTQWTENLVELAKGVDLFICECSFYDEPVPFHLTYKELVENMPRLECERVLLTHLSRDMLSRRESLGFESAEDGLVIQV